MPDWTLGCDLAYPQTDAVDGAKLYADGIRFAFIKATEGQSGVDPYFRRNVEQCRAAGILVGCYHVIRSTQPGDAQAEHFYNVTWDIGADLPPVGDWELPPHVTGPAQAFFQRTETLWERVPILYTYPFYWAELVQGGVAAWARYPLWLAGYPAPQHPGGMTQEEAQRRAPKAPKPWSKWAFWQSNGPDARMLPGTQRELDSNWWPGTLDELKAWCVSTGGPSTDPAEVSGRASEAVGEDV